MSNTENEETYLTKTYEKRIVFILAFFMMLLLIVIGRLFYFQVIHHKQFLALSQAQQRRAVVVNSNRGNIFDRNNNLYATSIDSYSLYGNPKIIKLTSSEINNLSAAIHVLPQKIEKDLSVDFTFTWIKRKLTKEEEEAFRFLKYEGIYFAYDKYKKPYIYVNSSEVKDKERYAQYLSKTLNVDYAKILNNLKKINDFFTVKKNISNEELQTIKRETYYGFELSREDKRIYLKGTCASDILGYVGMDNEGFAGIEYNFNNDMKGKGGKILVEYDRKGNEIFTHTKKFTHPENGKNIYLTIDNYIQFVSERAIKKAVEDFNAERGMVVAMEPETGDILALAVYPTFDPNNYMKYDRNVLMNDLISLVYEPGSTFKVVTIASALDLGVVDENTRIACPPTLEVGSRVIREAHSSGGTKVLTTTEILRDSINVGTAKIGMMMSPKVFYEKVKSFGIGQRTGIDLPFESMGIFRNYKTWYESDRAIIPFGHAVSVTALQIINAISSICNDGVLLKPKIVKKIASYDEKYVHTFPTVEIRRVIKSESARKVRNMMREAVIHGTGASADIPGYSVIGKTGTAWKVDPNTGRYKRGSYIASFIGALPKDKPKMVLAIIIDDPTTTIWGSTAAAPVFKEIMQHIVNYLEIPPDIVTDNTKSEVIAHTNPGLNRRHNNVQIINDSVVQTNNSTVINNDNSTNNTVINTDTPEYMPTIKNDSSSTSDIESY
ncbi:MAG: hypothetical protein DKM50_11385 [Candidatus Margulisiibacteriota bacterium]|nr:MAG: hypothetical protein A2X43_12125 [Candidatus Margulisbacteria bacterium GWD2_39_127]OGI03203.1 MAG: hypothetical protein A2X42_11365 [Candidatus Margulisbacteria bacterium GWF2_38_17]OGI11227.1 MAG: hypothetical protein A2X41_03790 [Candidatus Margulisbacteria bacterium GWE2_39_32]PZM78558.1 MAG: hypothetical protein DKM50_11385 [Candidatus Margulisiibacteriota bacterium]HAR63875.1 hypothetical protein [Candidatus Margulisiibacteriota bacterium]